MKTPGPAAAIATVAFGLALAAWPGCARAPESPSAVLAAAALCHGAAPAEPADGPTRAPGLVAGLGDVGFRSVHASPEALRYFDEGVRLFHAFNAPEAVRALRWAERVDPACAMCAWAEAWARGPTINYSVEGADAAKARAAAERAATLSARLPEIERGLIAAVRVRYPLRDGKAVVDDRAYAAAMEALSARFPADDAVAIEAASALLIASGQAWANLATAPPKPEVRRARALIETVLARTPDYTPAIHFQIHLMEWTGEPARAVAAADRLGRLAPAAGHLVHMPSHLYYRLGRYEDAAESNARAVAADRAFVAELKPPGGLKTFALHGHNLAFGLAGSLMSGDGVSALAFARAARDTYGADRDVARRGLFALARYAPPAEVLKAPPPSDAGGPMAQLLWRYARGEARARVGDAAGVAEEARAAAATPKQAELKDLDRDLGELARLMLQARADMVAGRPGAAVAGLRRAADLRDRVDLAPDPPSWAFPPRRTLGAALLLSGDVAGARAELAKSLVRDPGDALALYALAEAQRRAGAPEAGETRAAAKRAWRGDASAFRLETV